MGEKTALLQLLEQHIDYRRRCRRLGLFGVLSGTLVLLDSPYPFPIPLVGLPSVILSIFILLPALNFIYRGLRLPVKEALLFLHYRGGQASSKELLDFLQGEGGSSGQELFDCLAGKELAVFAGEDMDYVESHNVIAEDMLLLLPGAKPLIKKWLSRYNLLSADGN